MFVSSYSTYIQPNTSDKANRQRVEKPDNKSKSFESSLDKNLSATDFKSSNLPIDYVSNNKVLRNKQFLEGQSQQFSETQDNLKKFTNKFITQNSLINAKDAYENNSKMFSLFKKPHATLNQTPNIENTLPKEPQDIKELNMRNLMVNTYISNDNYYKITA